jgi:hypothetical protein
MYHHRRQSNVINIARKLEENFQEKKEKKIFSLNFEKSVYQQISIFSFIFRHSLPITTNLENLKKKVFAARNNIHVDLAFIGGITRDNHEDLISLANNGVVGFKCLLSPGDIEEFSYVPIDELESVMEIVEETGLPLIVRFDSLRKFIFLCLIFKILTVFI